MNLRDQMRQGSNLNGLCRECWDYDCLFADLMCLKTGSDKTLGGMRRELIKPVALRFELYIAAPYTIAMKVIPWLDI